MTQQDQQPSAKKDRQEAHERFWETIGFPIARGLEAFFWNLLWFALMVVVLFRLFFNTF
jgi:disulfide bond formation protein DsbB